MKWTVLVAAIDVGLLWLMLGTDVIVAAPRREPAVVQAIQLTPCDVRIAQLERRVAGLRAGLAEIQRHARGGWNGPWSGPPPEGSVYRENYDIAGRALERDERRQHEFSRVSVPQSAPEVRP